jgi:hypothetical protein
MEFALVISEMGNILGQPNRRLNSTIHSPEAVQYIGLSLDPAAFGRKAQKDLFYYSPSVALGVLQWKDSGGQTSEFNSFTNYVRDNIHPCCFQGKRKDG